jgi:hypothetical protein
MAAGLVSSGLLAQSGNFVNLWLNGRTLVRFRTDDGRLLKLKLPHLNSMRLVVPGPGEEWQVQYKNVQGKGKERTLLVGSEAQRFVGAALPRLNSSGGSQATVRDAVAEIERTGGPESFLLALTARATPKKSGTRRGASVSTEDPHGISQLVQPLATLPRPLRLATEMALHEEQERRALEGELAVLETAWREAEEIAGIADDLLVPDTARSFLDRYRSNLL